MQLSPKAVPVKPDTTTRLVGVNKKNNEFIIFDETRPGEYHGHVREWKGSRPEQQDALVKAGNVDGINGKEKILD